MTGGQDNSGDAVRQLLAEIQQRAEAATEGPWRSHESLKEQCVSADLHMVAECGVPGHSPSDTTVADAAFIAAARSDVPRLVAALTAVLDIHDDNGHGWCQGCPWDTTHHGWTTRTDECRVLRAVAAALQEQP